MCAKALLRLAGCYEKLGQQAQKVYEQIVHDFADQPAAAKARARLASLKQGDRPAAPMTMTLRKVDALGSDMIANDTDGRRAVYLDDQTNELIYMDVARHSKRMIYRAKPNVVGGWFPSKDFSKVAIVMNAKGAQTADLAVININGSGYQEIAKLNLPDDRLAQSFYMLSWSWDNRFLLCREPEGNGSRLIRISASDGQIRVLRDQKGFGKARSAGAMNNGAFFSPDGRFIASRWGTQIDVLPAEGGSPKTVYDESKLGNISFKLIDWTADGRYLVVGSRRTGKPALYLVPIKDDRSEAEPVFLRYGDFQNGGTVTAAGSLIYRSIKAGGMWEVYLASLDLNSKPGPWERMSLPLGNGDWFGPAPVWSADSSRIVYIASNEDAGQGTGRVVHLRDVSSGEDRVVYRADTSSVTCRWAVQQPKLFCSADPEILSISLDGGEEIKHFRPFAASKTWSADFVEGVSQDGQALHIGRQSEEQSSDKLLRWEIESGQQTVLEQGEALQGVDEFVVTDRWILHYTTDGVRIRPTAGGDWNHLLSSGVCQLAVTRDGDCLIYHNIDAEGRHGLFRMKTSGGAPERLGDFPTKSMFGTMDISPDGRKVVVTSGPVDLGGTDFWSLENFEPVAAKQQMSRPTTGSGK